MCAHGDCWGEVSSHMAVDWRVLVDLIDLVQLQFQVMWSEKVPKVNGSRTTLWCLLQLTQWYLVPLLESFGPWKGLYYVLEVNCKRPSPSTLTFFDSIPDYCIENCSKFERLTMDRWSDYSKACFASKSSLYIIKGFQWLLTLLLHKWREGSLVPNFCPDDNWSI